MTQHEHQRLQAGGSTTTRYKIFIENVSDWTVGFTTLARARQPPFLRSPPFDFEIYSDFYDRRNEEIYVTCLNEDREILFTGER